MKKLIGILLVSTLFAGCGVEVIETGYRGVETRFGKVVSESLPEGMYFYNPFTSDITEMDARVLKREAETTAYTKDVQQATVGYTLNYRLDPTKAHLMYQTVGKDWDEKLVVQVILEDIKREFGQHNAVDIIAQRNDAARAIEAHVKATLTARDVIVTNFQLTGIDFTDQFEHAVEAKVVAQQKAIEEQNRTKQIEEKARQTVMAAKAEAESIQIRAAALEQNAKLVEWEAVQKWDGKLPVYSMGGAVPFINMPQHK